MALRQNTAQGGTSGTIITASAQTGGRPGRLPVVDPTRDPTSDIYSDSITFESWMPYVMANDSLNRYQRHVSDDTTSRPYCLTSAGTPVPMALVSSAKAWGKFTSTQPIYTP